MKTFIPVDAGRSREVVAAHNKTVRIGGTPKLPANLYQELYRANARSREVLALPLVFAAPELLVNSVALNLVVIGGSSNTELALVQNTHHVVSHHELISSNTLITVPHFIQIVHSYMHNLKMLCLRMAESGVTFKELEPEEQDSVLFSYINKMSIGLRNSASKETKEYEVSLSNSFDAMDFKLLITAPDDYLELNSDHFYYSRSGETAGGEKCPVSVECEAYRVIQVFENIIRAMHAHVEDVKTVQLRIEQALNKLTPEDRALLNLPTHVAETKQQLQPQTKAAKPLRGGVRATPRKATETNVTRKPSVKKTVAAVENPVARKSTPAKKVVTKSAPAKTKPK